MARTKPHPAIPAFEGENVVGTSIQVVHAGDGLSKAMSIDNELLRRHQIIHIVLECEVSKVAFGDAKDVDGTIRIQTLKAGRATIIDGALVAEMLDEQDRRIEEAHGVHRLPIELVAAHEEGDHAAGLVDGCPLCDVERAAVDKEKRTKK